MEIQDRQEYTKKYERDNLYHPDTLALPSQLDALVAITDPGNSYESNFREFYNVPTFFLRWKKFIPGKYMKMEYISWNFVFSNMLSSDHLSYCRNNITQEKKRISYSFSPSFSFKILPTKKQGEQLSFQLGYNQRPASIFDLLNYKDDATPQIVKLGNPHLKGSASTTFSINFTDWESKRKGQQYHLNGNFSYYHRQVAQSVIFNPKNSQYTYQPKNVRGAYNASIRFDFTRFLDKRQYWSWQTDLDAAYHHSIDHVMQTGMTESTPNAVNTLTLHDGVWLQYQYKDFSIRVNGDFRWRHSEGKMRNFSILNTFDYQYGIAARYTVPVMRTSIIVDGNMYSRQGYGSKDINRNDFVMNASISQPFMKGTFVISAEAFDLLHHLSSTQYVINAQGRTVTWNRALPNYLMLHAVYHFSRQPKK